MTAHQFAHQLLNGPDLPILVPKVKEYSDDEDDSCAVPNVSKMEGRDDNDSPCDVLVISYRSDGGRRGDSAPDRKGSGHNAAMSEAAERNGRIETMASLGARRTRNKI